MRSHILQLLGCIIEGGGAVRVAAGCYDLCTLFKADSVTVLVLYCISSLGIFGFTAANKVQL
jgi:hypothetical protein